MVQISALVFLSLVPLTGTLISLFFHSPLLSSLLSEAGFSDGRPEVMDPAVLRPGRFGKLIHVPLPSSEDRGLILKALAKGKPIDHSVDLAAIGQMEACKNFSGADLRKLVCLCFY